MCGIADKAVVGGGKKTSLFSVILRDYGPDAAAATMNRLAKLAARWLTNFGFSLGINDVIPGPILSAKKDQLVEAAYAKCLDFIELAKLGKLNNKPGCDQDQTLESEISGVLNKVRDDTATICMQELSRHNAPLIMATCGSKVKTAETGYMQRRLMKALEDLTTHYDLSVRNAVGGMVQFTFGGDGLDPACLEGDSQPIDLGRAWKHIAAITPGSARGLLPYEITEITNHELSQPRFARDCTAVYVTSVQNFIREHIVQRLADARRSRGMFEALERSSEWDADTDLSMGASNADKVFVDNVAHVSKAQLQAFLSAAWIKYSKAKIEPGSTVGAVGAQSIGEPGTQMTLKTFHFAGVATMNVTLGVPRIQEIINAAKTISTPIISCKLVTADSEASARIVKGRLEKTLLGDVASIIEEAWGQKYTYIGVIVDMESVQKLQLELVLDDIKWAIVAAPRLKIKQESKKSVIVVPNRNRLRIYIEGADRYYRMREIKRLLPSVVVKGVPTISRAVINKIDRDGERGKKGDNELLVEGYGLRKVLGTEGIVGEQVTTNHVIETAEILGIESARQTIINEIQFTMQSHGMSIDIRHVMLLGDVMTYKGEVLGITRFDVAKMKDSVLMLASFEKTTDHLFDASAAGKVDSIAGVSESIIMGNPAANCGTSMPALILPTPALSKPRNLLFENSL
ncbi:hypothetical protein EWM64_g9743 [Hericium alpestre]|uniref:DNA-directed RNA polymerase n=1 Tax=Hericium alpestre TaxID=135208 RepID=A0A4Y9ZJB2_9AGAM|nr:hypothetical protein EWM64_g9743 [Hericium alpestre]